MPHNFKRVQRPENSTRSHKSVLTRTEGTSISTDCALQRAREENETKKQPIQLREKEKQTEYDSTAEDQATEQAKTDPTRPRKQEKKSHGIECQDRKSQERQPSGVFLSGLCALQTLDYVSGSYWLLPSCPDLIRPNLIRRKQTYSCREDERSDPAFHCSKSVLLMVKVMKKLQQQQKKTKKNLVMMVIMRVLDHGHG